MNERAMMIADVDEEVKTSSFVAYLLGVWHLRDASMKIQFSSNANRFLESDTTFYHTKLVNMGDSPNAFSAEDTLSNQKAPIQRARTSSKE